MTSRDLPNPTDSSFVAVDQSTVSSMNIFCVLLCTEKVHCWTKILWVLALWENFLLIILKLCVTNSPPPLKLHMFFTFTVKNQCFSEKNLVQPNDWSIFSSCLCSKLLNVFYRTKRKWLIAVKIGIWNSSPLYQNITFQNCVMFFNPLLNS